MNTSSNTKSKDFIQDFFENFNSKFFVYIIRKSKLFILLILLLSILIPIVHLRYTNPIFETKATLIRKSESKNSILNDDRVSALRSNEDEEIIKDIQILKSDFLLNKIVDSLQMNVSVYKAGRLPFKKHELSFTNQGSIINSNYKIKDKRLLNSEIKLNIDDKSYSIEYTLGDEEKLFKDISKKKIFENSDLKIQLNLFNEEYKKGEYKVIFNSENKIKNYIQQKVEIYNRKPNLEFIINGENSAKSEYILNNLLTSFINQDQTENSEKIQNAINYIRTFLDTVNIQLKESQYKKADYAKANNIFNPENQIATNLTQIQNYKVAIDDVKLKVLELNSMNSKLKSANTENLNFPEIQELINRKNELLIDLTPEHPSILSINSVIEDKVKNRKSQLVSELKTYRSKLSQIQSNKSNANSSLNKIPEKSLKFNQLNKEVEINEKYVLYLLEKQIQYLILKSSINSDYIILHPPKTDPILKSPNKKRTYIVAFFAFLLSTLGLILFRYLKFDKIIHVEEIKNKLQSPVLGFIPFIESAQIQNINESAPESRLVVINNPKSSTSEIFKKMRASLRYTGDGNYQTVTATSTISGEGKTFVLINLAAVHAQLDKKTLIIDLDLRKPRIAKSFNIENNRGISSILTGHNTVEECIHKDVILKNLDVITSGIIPPNPSELIMSSKFDDFLNKLKKEYDYVFIDTPPIGLVNESLEIINKVDIPMYVIRFNYSHKEFLDNIRDLEQKLIKKNNLMLILNHYGEGASNYVNNYSYSYQYGYNNYSEGYYTTEYKKETLTFFEKFKNFWNWDL